MRYCVLCVCVCVCTCSVSLVHVQLFVALWTITCQALCPWNFQAELTGVGFPNSRGIFPDRDQMCFLHLHTLAGGFFTYPGALGSPGVKCRKLHITSLNVHLMENNMEKWESQGRKKKSLAVHMIQQQ